MRRGRASSIRQCFVDTSAYFALADSDDDNHQVARAVLHALSSQAVKHVTTNYVIAETHALMVNRLNRSIALTFMQQLRAGNTTILRVPSADEARAWQIIEAYTDKDFTFTDAASFAVMERLRIRHVFTFDDDFRQYGFTMLTPELLTS
jgi:uncharacterized protein